MTKKVVVAGATESFINHVVLPVLESRGDCSFVLTTTENVEINNPRVVLEICDNSTVVSKAIDYVKEDPENTILMKGLVQTSDLLREVLRTDNGLKTGKLLSQITLVKMPTGREFLLTDGALNITPGVSEKIQITENVVEVALAIGLEKPKIAVLSSIEFYNPKMPSSAAAKEVAEHFEGYQEAIVEGPISMDIAVDKFSAETKGYTGEIMGDADALVVPNIDAGNILYKALARFMDAKMSGIVAGAKIPIVLTSRSDSYEAKVNSLDFALRIIKK